MTGSAGNGSPWSEREPGLTELSVIKPYELRLGIAPSFIQLPDT